MVVGCRIAELSTALGSLGNTCLDGHDRLHLPVSRLVVVAYEFEHLHDMHLECLTDFRERLLLTEIVFLLSERKPTLRHINDVVLRVHHIGSDIESKRQASSFEVVLHHKFECLFAVLDLLNFLKVCENWFHSLLVLTHGVHIHGIEVTHLLCHCSALMLGGREFLDQRLDLVFVVLRHDVEGSET